MRRSTPLSVTLCLIVTLLAAPVTLAADEILPACGIYQPDHILVDGFVNQPGVFLTVDQLAALPDQKNIDISFVDRLGKTQHHSESGPRCGRSSARRGVFAHRERSSSNARAPIRWSPYS